jgi:hypothetical protein
MKCALVNCLVPWKAGIILAASATVLSEDVLGSMKFASPLGRSVRCSIYVSVKRY